MFPDERLVTVVITPYEDLHRELNRVLVAVRQNTMTRGEAEIVFGKMLAEYTQKPNHAVHLCMVQATQAKCWVPAGDKIFDPRAITTVRLIQAKLQLVQAVGDVSRGLPNPTWATSIITLSRVHEALSRRTDHQFAGSERWAIGHLRKAYDLLSPNHAAFDDLGERFPGLLMMVGRNRSRIEALLPASADTVAA